LQFATLSDLDSKIQTHKIRIKPYTKLSATGDRLMYSTN
jgi:hypothetical protein